MPWCLNRSASSSASRRARRSLIGVLPSPSVMTREVSSTKGSSSRIPNPAAVQSGICEPSLFEYRLQLFRVFRLVELVLNIQQSAAGRTSIQTLINRITLAQLASMH